MHPVHFVQPPRRAHVLDDRALMTKPALLACVLLSLLACQPRVPPRPAPDRIPTTTGAVVKAPVAACGLEVDGTLVVFEETPEGARLYFLTSPALRVTLRHRARDAARQSRLLEELAPAGTTIDVDDIEEGVVVELTSASAETRNALRVKVYARALEINDACRWELIEDHFVKRRTATPL